MAKLQRIAEGYDQNGNPVSRQEQLAAIHQWQEIQRNKQLTKNDTARAQSEVSRADSDRLRAESDRLRAEAEVEVLRKRFGLEEQRLQLEATEVIERLQIEKAKVVVLALEVAVKGGANADQILSAVQDLSKALTERPALPELSGPVARKELTGPTEADESPGDVIREYRAKKRDRHGRLV